MIEVVLPRTDGGVLAQFVVVSIAAVVALIGLWRWRDLRVLVIGVAVLAYGVMAVRAVH